MNLDALFNLLREAEKLSCHRDFVVIGSLSVLGLAEGFAIPDAMTMSNDVDCYTQADPGRIFDVVAALGENSPYHQRCGFYLDAVSPELPSLPEGWQGRLIKVERDSVRAWFLDPNDAALSKYARGEPRDRRWIQAGILAGVVSMPVVATRFQSTHFYDTEEAQKARGLVDEDSAWFELVKDERMRGMPADAPGLPRP